MPATFRPIPQTPRNYMSVELVIPTRPEEMARRHWNRIVKEAMHACLVTHHKQRIPGHFKLGARSKYGYKPRSAKYEKAKRAGYYGRKSFSDLVKTGASERRMKREGQYIIGGAAEGGKKPIVGRLRLKFDFTQTAAFKASQKKRFVRSDKGWYDNAKTRGGVTIADMKREIQAMTTQERREVRDQLLREIWKRYQAFKAKRRRIRMPTK